MKRCAQGWNWSRGCVFMNQESAGNWYPVFNGSFSWQVLNCTTLIWLTNCLPSSTAIVPQYWKLYIIVFNCGFNLCRKAVLGIQRHHTPAWLPKGYLHVWEWHASTEYWDCRLVGGCSQNLLLQRRQVCLFVFLISWSTVCLVFFFLFGFCGLTLTTFLCTNCFHADIGDTMRICGPWILDTQSPLQCGKVFQILLRVPS